MITFGISSGHFTAPWDFFFSLYNAMVYLGNKKIPGQLLRIEGPLIEENRNDIWKKTVEGSYLIMIDDDMVFESSSIYNIYKVMNESKLDICCGLFTDEYGQPRIQKDGKFMKSYPKDKLFEVDACGMAFTMFSPEVVETLRSVNPFNRLNSLGEDLSFCKKAKEHGFKIWCNPTIEVGHLRLKAIYEKSL